MFIVKNARVIGMTIFSFYLQYCFGLRWIIFLSVRITNAHFQFSQEIGIINQSTTAIKFRSLLSSLFLNSSLSYVTVANCPCWFVNHLLFYQLQYLRCIVNSIFEVTARRPTRDLFLPPATCVKSLLWPGYSCSVMRYTGSAPSTINNHSHFRLGCALCQIYHVFCNSQSYALICFTTCFIRKCIYYCIFIFTRKIIFRSIKFF